MNSLQSSLSLMMLSLLWVLQLIIIMMLQLFIILLQLQLQLFIMLLQLFIMLLQLIIIMLLQLLLQFFLLDSVQHPQFFLTTVLEQSISAGLLECLMWTVLVTVCVVSMGAATIVWDTLLQLQPWLQLLLFQPLLQPRLEWS